MVTRTKGRGEWRPKRDDEKEESDGPELREHLEIQAVRVPQLERDRAMLVPVLLKRSGP
jgi:hypothetical protein